MPDPKFTLLAATGTDHATDALRLVAASTDGTVAGIEAATRDIAQMPSCSTCPASCRPPTCYSPASCCSRHARACRRHALDEQSRPCVARPRCSCDPSDGAPIRSRAAVRPARPAHVRNVRVGRIAGVFRPGPRLAPAGFFAGIPTRPSAATFILPDGRCWPRSSPCRAVHLVGPAACSWIWSGAARRSRTPRPQAERAEKSGQPSVSARQVQPRKSTKVRPRRRQARRAAAGCATAFRTPARRA